MKKTLLCLLALALLISTALPALACENDGYSRRYDYMRVTGCSQWVSLRESPSTSAKRLVKVPLGAMVYIYPYEEAMDGFMHVYYNGKTGYVLQKYLMSTADEHHYLYAANCKEWISLREHPVTSAERIEKIPLGAMVETFGRENNFMEYIRYNGRDGYALSAYLCMLPPSVSITQATLIAPDSMGNLVQQVVADPALTAELTAMIRRAKPGEIGKCPIDAVLTLALDNGMALQLMHPTDGCPSLILDGTTVYDLTDADRDRLHEIFSDVWQKIFV